MPSKSEQILKRLRKICMAFPEATERLSHGEPTWFVQDKKVFVSFDDHSFDGASNAISTPSNPLRTSSRRSRRRSASSRSAMAVFSGTSTASGMPRDTNCCGARGGET